MINVEALVNEILTSSTSNDEAAQELTAALNDLIYSSHLSPDGLLTWQERAAALEEQLVSYKAAWKFVSDLDRCQHGRHENDPCFNCPERKSVGNMWMVDLENRPDHDPKRGAQLGLGHTLGGEYTYFLRRRPRDGRPPVAMLRRVKDQEETTVLIRELDRQDETEKP